MRKNRFLIGLASLFTAVSIFNGFCKNQTENDVSKTYASETNGVIYSGINLIFEFRFPDYLFYDFEYPDDVLYMVETLNNAVGILKLESSCFDFATDILNWDEDDIQDDFDASWCCDDFPFEQVCLVDEGSRSVIKNYSLSFLSLNAENDIVECYTDNIDDEEFGYCFAYYVMFSLPWYVNSMDFSLLSDCGDCYAEDISIEKPFSAYLVNDYFFSFRLEHTDSAEFIGFIEPEAPREDGYIKDNLIFNTISVKNNGTSYPSPCIEYFDTEKETISQCDSASLLSRQKATLKANSNTEYTFTEWKSDDGLSAGTGETCIIYSIEETTYTAYYKSVPVVTVDNQDGTPTFQFSIAESITPPTSPGKIFGGYFCTSIQAVPTQIYDSAGKYVYDLNNDLNGLTIKAKWLINKSDARYHYLMLNNNPSLSGTENEGFVYGQNVYGGTIDTNNYYIEAYCSKNNIYTLSKYSGFDGTLRVCIEYDSNSIEQWQITAYNGEGYTYTCPSSGTYEFVLCDYDSTSKLYTNLIIRKKGAQYCMDFVNLFNDTFVGTNGVCNAPSVSGINTAWSNMKTAYTSGVKNSFGALTDVDKAYITSVTSSDTLYNEKLINFIGYYEYIYTKYVNLTSPKLDDFAGRFTNKNIPSNVPTMTTFTDLVNNNSNTLIMSALFIVSTLSIGGYILLKKKEY